MERYVRDVEKIIDSHHKSNPLFSIDRKTALFNALTVFEDFCRLGGMNTLLSGDPIQHGLFVRDQLDAINVLIEWIFCSCPNKPEVPLDTHIDDSRMLNVAQVFELFAKPYAALCSAYISYSRKMFSASVDKEQKTICFHENPDNKEIVISDLMESIHRDQGFSINDLQNQQQEEAFRRLVSSISTSSGRIVYCTDDTIWVPFRKIMKNQWVSTSELPDEWEFDSFSIGEFKEVWISLATLCLIHTTACLQSNAPGLCVDEVLLVKSPEEFASFINQKSRISIDRVLSIISLLTYDNGLNKNDIIYVSIDTITEIGVQYH